MKRCRFGAPARRPTRRRPWCAPAPLRAASRSRNAIGTSSRGSQGRESVDQKGSQSLSMSALLRSPDNNNVGPVHQPVGNPRGAGSGSYNVGAISAAGPGYLHSLATIETPRALDHPHTAAAARRSARCSPAERSGSVLRVAIQGGGCRGFQYALGFDRGAARKTASSSATACASSSIRSSAPYLHGCDSSTSSSRSRSRGSRSTTRTPPPPAVAGTASTSPTARLGCRRRLRLRLLSLTRTRVAGKGRSGLPRSTA